ncbi:MAG: DUF5691 domain-containing protein [Ardenticatenaceae bacterium]|nr:DUF5691 domain-containing protein [Ardenticatenaceae bacterium]
MNWSKLTRDALVGTGRQHAAETRDARGPFQPVDHLLNQLPTDDAAQKLLLTAGVTHLYEEAGQQPLQLSPDRLWAVAEEDKRPLCPSAISDMLTHMINGRHRELLETFLINLRQSGFRLPAQLLPNLLAYGSRIHRYQTDIMQILGPRGRWLAGHNPKWEYATLDVNNWGDLVNRWQTGKLSDRTRLLDQIRYFDAESGRQLLETTWKSEPNNSRIYFLRKLETGLSMTDEPFLERALDDRHQPVRRQASKLLVKLPQSRFAKRMGEYLTQVIRWKPRRKGNKITVAFPQEPSAAMIRDGIMPQQKRRIGFYIRQQITYIASAAPLSCWIDHWGVEPEQVVEAVFNSGWSKTLVAALSTAARQQPEAGARWALPLARGDQFSKQTVKLLALLPPTEREETLLLLLEQGQEDPFDKNLPLKTLWREWPYSWSAESSRRLAAIFARYVQNEKESPAVDLSSRALYRRFMRHVPVHLYDEIEDILEPALESTPQWRSEILEGLNSLKFRGEMKKLFDSNESNQSKEILFNE